MAAFVEPRAGSIPVDRRGYEISELAPPYIAPSRVLTIDDLKKRGFGESIPAGSTQAQRATRIVLQDMIDLDRRITRREEWMCVQVMLTNGCEMQQYIDAETKGIPLRIRYFEEASDHTYTVATKWDSPAGKFFADVEAMCWKLAKRGLQVADLILGSQAAQAVCDIEKVQRLLDNRNMTFGTLAPRVENYAGVAYIGSLIFGGFTLNILNVLHSYVDDDNSTKTFFPATSAMVTAPGCGRLMYGQVTQIDYGQEIHSTYAFPRVPKLTVDQPADTRSIRLAARPLPAPNNYCPYIYAENVV
jgi:hypothetical protein